METIIERALGATVTITANGAFGALEELNRLERLLAPTPDAPLARLNRDGDLEQPPLDLVQALRHALEVAALTHGLVTPAAPSGTGQVRRWAREDRFEPSDPPAAPAPPWYRVEVSRHRIALPPGARIDLSGTLRSWIVERAGALLEGEFVISVGSDLLARQSGPFQAVVVAPDGASLGYELPAGTWGICTLNARGHPQTDPRTGAPLASRFEQVTAISSRATTAEMLARLAFFGEDALRPFSREIKALLTFDADHNRTTRSNPSVVPPEA